MDVRITIEETPNPDALKFIANYEYIEEGTATFSESEVPEEVALLKALFALGNIMEIHLFGCVMTITKMPHIEWEEIESFIVLILQESLPSHNPDIKYEKAEEKVVYEGDLAKIDKIIDKQIRKYLQLDGGDLTLISYKDKELVIAYQGACGTCPSSLYGTLNAIENTLQQEFDPEIHVRVDGMF